VAKAGPAAMVTENIVIRIVRKTCFMSFSLV